MSAAARPAAVGPHVSTDGPPISVEVLSSVRHVPAATWDSLVGPDDPLWSHGLFCATEVGRIGPTGWHHIVARREGRLVGILPAQRFAYLDLGEALGHQARHVLNRLRRLTPRAGVIDALVVGNLLGDGRPRVEKGEDRIVIEQALVSAVARLARDLGCSWTIWKDIPSAETSLLQAAAASKFFPVPALPDTRIALGAGSFEDHLRELPSKARRNCRAKRRRLLNDPSVTVEVVDRVDSLAQPLTHLYRNVLERAEERLDVLTPAFFKALATFDTGAQFIVARRGGDLIGFLIWLTRGSTAVALRVGLDYATAPEVFVYHNLHYRGLELAIDSGCSSVQMLQTAYEAKRELGAQLVPSMHLVKHRNQVLRVCLSKILPRAVPIAPSP